MEIKTRNGDYAQVLLWLKVYRFNDLDSVKSILLIKLNDSNYQIARDVKITFVGETDNIIDSNVYTFDKVEKFSDLQKAMLHLGVMIKRKKLDKSITYFKTFNIEVDTPEIQAIYKDIVNRSMKVELLDDEIHDIKRMKVINELKEMEKEE